MCGILFVDRKDGRAANRQVLKRYRKQAQRGREGFGFIALDPTGKLMEYKRFQFEHELERAVERSHAPTILLHHRWPTSAINVPEAAHPIKVHNKELKYTYYVIHNGVITNDDLLKEKHEQLGYKYTTELQQYYEAKNGKQYTMAPEWNDSEALAIELARTIEGKQNIVAATGDIAYMMLQCEGKQAIALYFGTNGGNPICVEENSDFVALASEGGKALPQDRCYRYALNVEVGKREIVEGDAPKLIVTPKPVEQQFKRHTVGFDYSNRNNTSVGISGGIENYADEVAREYEPGGRYGSRRYHSSFTLQDELSDLEEEMIGVQGDLAIAREEENLEEVEIAQDAMARLSERRRELEHALLAVL